MTHQTKSQSLFQTSDPYRFSNCLVKRWLKKQNSVFLHCCFSYQLYRTTFLQLLSTPHFWGGRSYENHPRARTALSDARSIDVRLLARPPCPTRPHRTSHRRARTSHDHAPESKEDASVLTEVRIH